MHAVIFSSLQFLCILLLQKRRGLSRWKHCSKGSQGPVSSLFQIPWEGGPCTPEPQHHGGNKPRKVGVGGVQIHVDWAVDSSLYLGGIILMSLGAHGWSVRSQAPKKVLAGLEAQDIGGWTGVGGRGIPASIPSKHCGSKRQSLRTAQCTTSDLFFNFLWVFYLK